MAIQLYGVQRSNLLSQSSVHKLNFVPLLMSYEKLCGFDHFFMKYTSLFSHHMSFGVATLVLFPCLRIPSTPHVKIDLFFIREKVQSGEIIVNFVLTVTHFIQRDSSLASLLLDSISSQVSRGLNGCVTASLIWQKLHRNFSSSSTTRIMHLYDQLKARKLVHQSIREYLTYIQTTCDSLVSCGHPIYEMEQIFTILNGVKCLFDNVIVSSMLVAIRMTLHLLVRFFWMLNIAKLIWSLMPLLLRMLL